MGLVLNRHATFLGRELLKLGFELRRQVAVPDDPPAMREALEEALARADLVITTGGLGPTSDDRTVEVIGQTLGLSLREDRAVRESIADRFARHGSKPLDAIFRQALIPEGAKALLNANGTAPGLFAPLQGKTARVLLVLPGPPSELEPMFENQAAPMLREEFKVAAPLDMRIVRVAQVGESVVQDMVEARLRESFPDLEIGYCARPGEVDVRLMSKARREILDPAEALAREILGEHVFGGDGAELEDVVVNALRQREQTLCVAESCTGGHLADRITNVPGASEVFRQGWVTYSNEAKIRELNVPSETLEKYGAVSALTAQAMADGARRRAESDFALAVTGIAGPSGGSVSKPVGTVFIALAGPEQVQVHKGLYAYDRLTFKWSASQAALNMLRLELRKER
ncbi:MAG: competence/damage-inducible protein A [Verrucomicrobiae bacterium]|nr:competence/damage-inducible protein A [Verrucomicrobiae bacterium]